MFAGLTTCSMRHAEGLPSVSVKARSRSGANVGNGSTIGEDWITSSLPASWPACFRVSFSSISQKDKLVCRSASIELFRSAPWVKRFGPSPDATKVTTLGVWSRRLLRPLLTSPHPSHAVASTVASRQTWRSPRVIHIILRPGPAGSTPRDIRVTIGLAQPLLGYPCRRQPCIRFLFVGSELSSLAFFRFHLTMDTLAWTGGSDHLGPQRTCTS